MTSESLEPDGLEMLTPEAAWTDLVEKDDRNSPADSPEMCLITFDELADYMAHSLTARPPAQGVGVGKLKEVERDAQRYRRLRVMGCAVMDHPNLEEGLVSRFTNLDDIIDADLKTMRSRGEFALATPSSEGDGAAPCDHVAWTADDGSIVCAKCAVPMIRSFEGIVQRWVPATPSQVSPAIGGDQGSVVGSADALSEEWRDVPGAPGYRASSLGRILGRRGSLVVGAADRDGYRYIAVSDPEGPSRRLSLHSMVAAAFLGPRPAGHDIDHIDRHRSHNAASNLRYITHAENMASIKQPGRGRAGETAPANPPLYAYPAVPLELLPTPKVRPRKGVRTGPHPNAILTEDIARQLLQAGKPKAYGAIAELARQHGVSRVAISDLFRGRTWKHLAANPTDSPLQGKAQ